MRRRSKSAPLDAEMDYGDPQRGRRKAMLIVGMLMAGIAGLTIYVASTGTAQAQPVATRAMIVAARDIPARTIISLNDLAQRSLPDDPYLQTAVVDPTRVVGKMAGVIILRDQPILPNLLTTTVPGAQFSILSPDETVSPDSPTWRAVSVSVPNDRAVDGQIEVGQHIDLIATIQVNVLVRLPDGTISGAPPSQGCYSDKSTKIAWENLEVLSKDLTGGLYVVKVDLHQAEEIAQVQAASSDAFTIALRADGDTRQLDRSGYGETLNRLIEQYGFPLPQIIPIDAYPQPSPGASP